MSKETALASGAINDREIFCHTPADIKLSKLPSLLFSYLNSGNIDGIRHIITTYFDEDCLLRTVVMDKSIRGRQHIMAMFEGIMLTHPDFCCIPKSSRVARELPVTATTGSGGIPTSGDSGENSSSSSSSSSCSSSVASSSSSCGFGSGITTRCSSNDEADMDVSPEMMGLPRCVLYKCFFTGS